MNVNRIFCIGKNYPEHVAEMAATEKRAPAKLTARPAVVKRAPAPVDASDFVVFMKPASCMVREREPIRLPQKRGAVHHEAELVVLMTGGGGDIPEHVALDYVAGITLGLDLTLRDLQTELKAKGRPWELAKSFDCAAPMGDFKPYVEQELQELEFSCAVNGDLRQRGRTHDMVYSVARQIHLLSQTWALMPGDVIYTGTPSGVGPLQAGDKIVLECAALGRFEWRCE